MAELLCPTTQKSNAAAVSDPYKEVQIQGERIGAGEDPATTSIFVAEFDFVGSALDDLAQFLTVKKHLCGDSSGIGSPDDPWARGEFKLQFLIGLCSFMQETSSFDLTLAGDCDWKPFIYMGLASSPSSYPE